MTRHLSLALWAFLILNPTATYAWEPTGDFINTDDCVYRLNYTVQDRSHFLYHNRASSSDAGIGLHFPVYIPEAREIGNTDYDALWNSNPFLGSAVMGVSQSINFSVNLRDGNIIPGSTRFIVKRGENLRSRIEFVYEYKRMKMPPAFSDTSSISESLRFNSKTIAGYCRYALHVSIHRQNPVPCPRYSTPDRRINGGPREQLETGTVFYRRRSLFLFRRGGC